MRLKQAKHRIWGDNLGRQIGAENTTKEGESKTKVVRHRLFGIIKWRAKEKVPVGARKPHDDESVNRTFRYTCGLKHLTFRRINGDPAFIGEFNALPRGGFWADDVHFRFDKKRVRKDGKPIVIVRFEGVGPRNGPLKDYNTLAARVIFHDQKQMEKYVRLPKGRRKIIRYQGVDYHRTSSGGYRSDDGGSWLPYLVLAYVLLGNDSQSFASGSGSMTDAFRGLETSSDIQLSTGGGFTDYQQMSADTGISASSLSAVDSMTPSDL